MNQEKRDIEISPTIVEQLKEEPTKYWIRGVSLNHFAARWNGKHVVYNSERAAWCARERAIASGLYFASSDEPYSMTREQVCASAIKHNAAVEVCDETGKVVDSWSVPK